MTSRNDLAEAEARLALARAEEINATNNLSYTEVRSPVNGVASMIPYRVGALVGSNIEKPLVTVSDDSEVYAYFSGSGYNYSHVTILSFTIETLVVLQCYRHPYHRVCEARQQCLEPQTGRVFLCA